MKEPWNIMLIHLSEVSGRNSQVVKQGKLLLEHPNITNKNKDLQQMYVQSSFYLPHANEKYKFAEQCDIHTSIGE